MKILVFVAALALAVVVALACSSSPPAAACMDIPDGGCPVSDGIACEDPTCSAVYSCDNGTWSFQSLCPAVDAGVDAGADGDAGHMPSFDAQAIDAPPGSYGGPGCADLEEPDCPLGVAIGCGVGCCDCEDLYVCVDMGWTVWGECLPDGGIVQTQ